MFDKRYLLYWATGAVILTAAAALLLMGREPICTCGYVKLWHGDTMSAENSQHLSDWYTPSHLLHGILFYAMLAPFAARTAFPLRLAIATFVEAGWEVLENTNAVIEHYRTVTISMSYYGDSVINSVADMATMVAGFFLARALPVWASVATVIGFEALTTYVIRDGLALNIIMFLYPLDAIKRWQGM